MCWKLEKKIHIVDVGMRLCVCVHVHMWWPYVFRSCLIVTTLAATDSITHFHAKRRGANVVCRAQCRPPPVVLCVFT